MKKGLSKAQHRELQRFQRLEYKLSSLSLPDHLPQPGLGEMVIWYEGEYFDLYLIKDRTGKTVRRHCVLNERNLANVV